MDYERFYRYLGSRSLSEVKECLRNVANVVDKLSSKSNPDLKLKSDPKVKVKLLPEKDELLRREVAQRLWTQQAVWSQFGAGFVKPSSAAELRDATSALFTEPKVAVFLAAVNSLIDDEVRLTKNSETVGLSTKVQQKSSKSSSPPQPQENTKRFHGAFQPHSSNQIHTKILANNFESSAEDDVQSISDQSDPSPSRLPPRRGRPKKEVVKAHKPSKAIVYRPWTKEEDAALCDAVRRGDTWAEVVHATGTGRTIAAAQTRWNITLRKGTLSGENAYRSNKQTITKPPINWSDEEVRRVCEFAEQCPADQRVQWAVIGKELGKVPIACYHRWKRMQTEQPAAVNTSSSSENNNVTPDFAVEIKREEAK